VGITVGSRRKGLRKYNNNNDFTYHDSGVLGLVKTLLRVQALFTHVSDMSITQTEDSSEILSRVHPDIYFASNQPFTSH